MDFLLFTISEVDKNLAENINGRQRRGEKLLFELTVTHLLRNLGYEAQLRDYVYWNVALSKSFKRQEARRRQQ